MMTLLMTSAMLFCKFRPPDLVTYGNALQVEGGSYKHGPAERVAVGFSKLEIGRVPTRVSPRHPLTLRVRNLGPYRQILVFYMEVWRDFADSGDAEHYWGWEMLIDPVRVKPLKPATGDRLAKQYSTFSIPAHTTRLFRWDPSGFTWSTTNKYQIVVADSRAGTYCGPEFKTNVFKFLPDNRTRQSKRLVSKKGTSPR